VSSAVVDPDGVRWSVRRRWYPWRRALSVRDLWSAAPGGRKADPDGGAEDTDAAEPSGVQEPKLPRNFLLKASFVAIAAIVYVVYGLGKLLFYTVVVVLFLVGSVIDLVLALAITPVVLLLRTIGHGHWPVEIGRQGEHFGTRHAPSFAAAGEMRNGLLDEIGRGVLPAAPQASRPDSKSHAVGSFED
jgi:hypothetical protein